MGFLGCVFKVGLIAYAVDWMHKNFLHRRDTLTIGYDDSSPSFSQSVDNALEKTMHELSPRVRQWLAENLEYHHSCRHNTFFHRRGETPATSTTTHPTPHMTELPNGLTVVDEDRTVVIKGEVKGSLEYGKRGRKVETRIVLPKLSDLGDVRATVEDGVLRVDAGKKTFEGRKIEIQ
ncbi:hypothetical protein HDU76_007499 [Blyttiomyces sp. JEL0837]|nr:hypothetical protein HDU76_007499 [Blyttiomyces sp. JEL0837]